MESKELVKKELKRGGADKSIISLCDKIFEWYEEGGKSQVKEKIEEKSEKIYRHAQKEIKEEKAITRPKKKRRKRRR